jgi:hypothetical protein
MTARRDAMTISTNMSSLTGFLFADNYNANINTNAAAAHFQLSTFNFQLILASAHFQLSTFNFQLSIYQMNQINHINQSSDNNAVIARSAATKQSLSQDAFIVRDCFAALAMTALFVVNKAFLATSFPT